MVRGKTIGIAIFYWADNSPRYLLLHHGGEYWNFPKGRQEAGETAVETALRELKEETGITHLNVIEGFKDGFEYDFDSTIKDGVREKVFKQAIFYLGEVKSEKVTISDEHLDYGWFDYSTALKRMYYQEGQNLLKRIDQFLSKQHDFVL